MPKMLLWLALSLVSGAAVAVPRVDCQGCATLREFGNFGAASLYRATGPMGPAVGSDQVWVDNPGSGRSVFVDVDTPFIQHTIMGTQVPIPDLTVMEINATWADGSGTGVWLLPTAVLAAIGESIELAENNGSPAVTPDEVAELPGLNGLGAWHTSGSSVDGASFGTLASGVWVFAVDGFGGGAVPVVVIVECAWQSLC